MAKNTRSIIPRAIESSIRADLEKKAVFIAGPRQCGKTTLAKKIASSFM
jgi:predicted AAA+ superfamily ATPase